LLGSLQVPEDDFYFPVAMYVHNRPHYFERALHNLEKASGVERVPLLIISMDSINPDMVALAENITFAPLRMIFHPPRPDATIPTAIIAIKSHWMWLQDMIWDGKIRELSGWNSNVALLEEDHAVTPDYFRLCRFFSRRSRRRVRTAGAFVPDTAAAKPRM